MGAAYSQDLRDRVLAAADRGVPTKQIARTFLVSPAWVRRIKQRRRECPCLKPGDVVVMDNLSSHKSPKIRALIEAAGGPAGLPAAVQPRSQPDRDGLLQDQAAAAIAGVPDDTPGCSQADFAEPYGTLNFFDVSAFLAAYNAADPSADLADPDGVFNFFDVSAFLALYNAGCP